MHFSVPISEDVIDAFGKQYCVFYVYVNGFLHSKTRYSQFRSLHAKLIKQYAFVEELLEFPAKHWFTLNEHELEDRRDMLETYLQKLSQNSILYHSTIFNTFLLEQQLSTFSSCISSSDLAVYLVNGHKIALRLSPACPSNIALELLANHLGIPRVDITSFNYYGFDLFMAECIKTDTRFDELLYLKKLCDFESPYLSYYSLSAELQRKMRIVLRKNVWSLNIELAIDNSDVISTLLLMQAQYEADHDFFDMPFKMSSLEDQSQSSNFMKIARRQSFYGYMKFDWCVCNISKKFSKVQPWFGEGRIILLESPDSKQEFPVAKIRSWSTTENSSYHEQPNSISGRFRFELAFEFHHSVSSISYIRLYSNEVIMMSFILQLMVEEFSTALRNSKPTDTVKITALSSQKSLTSSTSLSVQNDLKRNSFSEVFNCVIGDDEL